MWLSSFLILVSGWPSQGKIGMENLHSSRLWLVCFVLFYTFEFFILGALIPSIGKDSAMIMFLKEGVPRQRRSWPGIQSSPLCWFSPWYYFCDHSREFLVRKAVNM